MRSLKVRHPFPGLLLLLTLVLLVALPVSIRAGESVLVKLTPEERAWLDNNPDMLTLFYNTSFPPIEFALDEGGFTGMGADVAAMVEKLLGITFIKSPSEDWNRHLAALESGECAVAPTIVRTPERERYAFFTSAYAVAPVVIICAQGVEDDDLTIDGLKGKKVAVVSGYATENYLLRKNRGRFEILTVPDVFQGLKAVSFGQADAFVENLAVASYYIEKEGISNLRLAGVTDYSFPFSIGVSRKYPLLFSAIQKALDAIPANELDAVRKRWISLSVREGLSPYDLHLLKLGAIFTGLLLLFLAAISYYLKNRLNEKVANLKKAQQTVLEQAELLKLATEATQAGVWDCRPQEKRIHFSDQWYAMLGYEKKMDPEGILLDGLYGYMHRDDLQNLENFFGSYIGKNGLGQFEGEFRLRRADGEWCWVLSKGKTVEWDEKGRPLRIIGLDTNIQTMKEAQAKTALSEKRFRAIFDHAPYPIVINRLEDGRLLEANKAYLEAQELSEEDLFNADDRAHFLLSAEDVKEVVHSLERDGAVYNREAEVLKRDGSTRHVLYSSVLLELEGGKQILSMTVDVTERKLAENSLRESEGKLRSIFAAMNDIIVVFDAEGRYLEIAPTKLGKKLRPAEDFLGRKLSEFFPPDKAREFLDAIQGALAKGDAVSLDYELPVQGRQTWFASTITPLAEDRVIWVARDITSRKLAEEMLRQSQEKFSKVFMMSPDLITITRYSDGKIMEMNLGAEEIAGWKRNEVIGKGYTDFSFWIDQDTRRNMVEELAAGKDVSHEEIAFRKKDGTVRLGVCSARLISLLDEMHIIFVMQDITDRRLLEKERRKLEQQLLQSQKLEAVGILAGGVAHDFNNMLGAIMGYAELAMRRLDAADPICRYFVQILEASRRSADLTRQLLAFARKQTVAPVVFDLNASIEGTLKMLRRLIGENIELAWLPDKGRCIVRMDPSQLDQVLANLCVNARDAITGVGRIVIKTGHALLDGTFFGNHPDFQPGEFIRLSVSDNGCGMEQDVLDHVFEPFFTTKEVGKGTGLGLATVYGIVKQNHGYIRVYSEPGQGTEFQVYLPALDQDSLTVAAVAGEEVPCGRGETILLVEDDTTIREMTQQILEQLDYRVMAAATPSEAIGLAENAATDIQLFFSDVILPEMNGRELAGLMSNIRPEMKHLFMSGYTADIIGHEGVLDESINFIQKPFTLPALAVKLRHILDQNRTA